MAEGREVDILVSCGGIARRAPAVTFPDDKRDAIVQVNLTAGFQLTRALAVNWVRTSSAEARALGEKKKIVNVASVLTYTGSEDVVVYACSKGGRLGS